MKYKPIFGDQSNFDKADADAVCAYYPGDGSSLLSFISEDKLKKPTRPTFLLINIVAMRRIIRTPVWTRADQLAGKLPEVGARVLVSPRVEARVTAVNTKAAVLSVQCDDQQLDVLSIDEILPIETEAERQQREREEWCQTALKLINDELTDACDAAVIYDALVSGELELPEVRK